MSSHADLRFVRLRLLTARHGLERGDIVAAPMAIDQARTRLSQSVGRADSPDGIGPLQLSIARITSLLPENISDAQQEIGEALALVEELVESDRHRSQ